MTNTVNNGNNRAKQYRGLKPFVKGDPRINRAGAPRRAQSWQETIKRLTDMTREEAINYFGANTKMGKLIKELSPAVPIKDGVIMAALIAFGREPNARMLSALMDREEGKPAQPITGDPDKPLKVIIEYVDTQDTTPAPAPIAETDQSGTPEV